MPRDSRLKFCVWTPIVSYTFFHRTELKYASREQNFYTQQVASEGKGCVLKFCSYNVYFSYRNSEVQISKSKQDNLNEQKHMTIEFSNILSSFMIEKNNSCYLFTVIFKVSFFLNPLIKESSIWRPSSQRFDQWPRVEKILPCHALEKTLRVDFWTLWIMSLFGQKMTGSCYDKQGSTFQGGGIWEGADPGTEENPSENQKTQTKLLIYPHPYPSKKAAN